jgi:hypothetical protein
MEELDLILLEQWHAAKKSQKVLKRIKKIFGDVDELQRAINANQMRLQFFESMIEDKSLFDKKIKKKNKHEDILDRNPIYYMYRNSFMAAAFGYMFFSSTIQKYWEHYRKEKK